MAVSEITHLFTIPYSLSREFNVDVSYGTNAMHDGICCFVSDHQMNITLHDALCDTLSPLYRV